MSLRFDADPSSATWLTEGVPDIHGAAVARRLLIGPDGFEAYARVLTLPDPSFPGQSETDLDDDELDAALSDVELVGGIVDVMTGSADDVELRFLLWNGWPYDPDLPVESPIDIAKIRQYALAQGTLQDWLSWVDAGAERGFAPGFVWPADRSWCITYDTDSHFAGVGGTAAAIDRLLQDPRLTVVAQASQEIPRMYE